jgi:hypothetical protein
MYVPVSAVLFSLAVVQRMVIKAKSESYSKINCVIKGSFDEEVFK